MKMKVKQKPGPRINLKDFKFLPVYRRVSLESWKDYYECCRKKDKTDEDKANIKQFRADLKSEERAIMTMHRKTKVSTTVIVDKIDRKTLAKDLLKPIQETRALRRKEELSIRHFDGADIPHKAGVRVEPGKTNFFSQFLTVNDPLKAKKPRMPNKNYIGIELEFNRKESNDIGTNGLAELFKKAGLARHVCVTIDGSCGHEVTVIVEQDNFEVKLREIMAVINKEGYKVSINCGTHVHLDMRNRDIKLAYNNLYMAQKFLRKFLTKERRSNRYCSVNNYSSFDEQLEHQKSNSDRYCGINTLSLKKHGTLEIRMHQGTLNADNLVTWIKVLCKVIDFKQKVEVEIPSLKAIRQTFSIEKSLWNKVLSQIKTVGGSAPAPGVTVTASNMAMRGGMHLTDAMYSLGALATPSRPRGGR